MRPIITAQKASGFTLIELMIAVAIIGILASLAIPTYLDYAVRAKISEALQIAAAAKISIAEFYVSNGKLPENADQAGIKSISTKHISAMDYAVADDPNIGRIVITLSDVIGGAANGTHLVVETSADGDGLLSWECKPAAANGVPKNLLPSSCRGS